MSIPLNVERISGEIASVITSVNSTNTEPLDVITPKVLTILANIEKIPDNSSIKPLLVDLENSLKSKNLNELGEKVHQFTLSHLAGNNLNFHPKGILLEGVIERLNPTNRDFCTTDIIQELTSFNWDATLAVLKNLYVSKDDPELVCKIIKLKAVIKDRLDCFRGLTELRQRLSFLKNTALNLFSPKEWASSEFLIHELLTKTPERFGLTEDQLFETAKLIVEKYPEHIDFLLENLKEFGLRQTFIIKKREGVDPLSQDHLNAIGKKLIEKVPVEEISKIPGLEFKEYETEGLSSEKRREIVELFIQKYPERLSPDDFNRMSHLIVWDRSHSRPQMVFACIFTKEQLLEFALHARGPLLRQLAFHADVNSLNQDQAFVLAKCLMEKDADGFNISSLNEATLWSHIPKIEIRDKEKLSELLTIGVVNHPTTIPLADFNVMFTPTEQIQLTENCPELFFFFEPKTPVQEQPSLAYAPFNQRMEDISKKEEPEKSILTKWLGHVEACRKFYGISDMGKEGEAVLDAIQELRSPALRYKITKCLFTVLTNETLKSTFESKKTRALFSGKFSPLFHLLLIPLISRNPNQETLFIIANVLNSKYYKDASRAKIAMSSFLAIENSSLTEGEKVNLLKVIFEEKSEGKLLYESINKNLQLVEALINLKYSDKLKRVENGKDLEFILQNIFIEATGIEAVQNFSEKYLQTFGRFRNPEAILIYAGKLKKELSSQNLAPLKTYTESVLNGNFSSLRYEERPGDHLSIVFAGRQDLKELWMKGSCQNLEECISTEADSTHQQFDVQKFLYERVCLDHHVSPQEFGYLARCLQNPTTIKEEGISLGQALKTEKNPNELDRLRLQKGLIALLNTGKSDGEKGKIFDTSIAKLVGIIFPGVEQFKQDLEDLRTAFESKKQTTKNSLKGWTIVDTDDSQDILMCGTEVIGSCQNINANASTNKCLLGYALDGKNRLVAVKNENGEIVARAILRILWDEINQTPVLFQERLYSQHGLDSRVHTALNQLFIDRSKALQLPLASESSPYPHPLRSFNSKALFEYVDAKGIGVTNGQYVI